MARVLLEAIAGSAYAAVAVVAARRFPRFALVAAAAALAWFAPELSDRTVLLHRPLMLHAALAFPLGRLPGRWTWPVLVAAWVSAVLLPVGRDPGASLVVTVLIGVAAWRLRTTAAPGRRTHGLVASRSAALLAAGLGITAAWRLLDPEPGSGPATVYSALVLLAGAVLLAGLLAPPERETDAVIELAEDRTTPAVLRHAALARTDATGRSLRAAADLLESNAALQVALSERVAEVRASRRRLVDAAVVERRRLEQVLADGAFVYLQSLADTLRRVPPPDDDAGRRLFAAAQDEVTRTRDDLDQLARGLHPRILTEHGLAAALADLAARSPVPLTVRAPAGRFPTDAEVAVWYTCAEAVTNLTKHAGASAAAVDVEAGPDTLVVSIRDDGTGGAEVAPHGGLAGLADRLSAVDGRLTVVSPPGGGTTVRAEVPLR